MSLPLDSTLVDPAAAIPEAKLAAVDYESAEDGRVSHFRWVILGMIFVIITLNFMDRIVLSMVAPDLRSKYHIDDVAYGNIGAAFSLAYAMGQLFAGPLMDRIGIRMGYFLSIAMWSLWAMLTAFGRSAFSFGV